MIGKRPTVGLGHYAGNRCLVEWLRWLKPKGGIPSIREFVNWGKKFRRVRRRLADYVHTKESLLPFDKYLNHGVHYTKWKNTKQLRCWIVDLLPSSEFAYPLYLFFYSFPSPVSEGYTRPNIWNSDFHINNLVMCFIWYNTRFLSSLFCHGRWNTRAKSIFGGDFLFYLNLAPPYSLYIYETEKIWRAQSYRLGLSIPRISLFYHGSRIELTS